MLSAFASFNRLVLCLVFISSVFHAYFISPVFHICFISSVFHAFFVSPDSIYFLSPLHSIYYLISSVSATVYFKAHNFSLSNWKNHLFYPSKVSILPQQQHQPQPPILPPTLPPPRYLANELSPKPSRNPHRALRLGSVHPVSMLSPRNTKTTTNNNMIRGRLRTLGHPTSSSFSYSILPLETSFRIHPFFWNKLRYVRPSKAFNI